MLDFIILMLCLLALYHHVIFPLVLKLVAPKPVQLPRTSGNWPDITIIVPAYNEADSVAQKILNTASLDYPADRLELIIACDGCSDQTVEVALMALAQPEAAHLKAHILNFPKNRGKVAVLNDMIAQSKSDIVALSDCSANLSWDALKRVARHLQPENVGVVGGSYRFAQSANAAEDAYWTYQRAIKLGEAHFGAPMGMHGAFYAFRKSLSRPLPANTINDDFILPMKIVAKGYRAVYDPLIRCIECETTTTEMNWKRRLRISAGNVQQALTCLDLLSPKRIGIAFCFFSGKFLRAWMPLVLAAIFCLSAIAALHDSFYQWFFMVQVMGLALISLPMKGEAKLTKILLTLRYIVIGHLAGLVGATRYLTGREKGAWKRANTQEASS